MTEQDIETRLREILGNAGDLRTVARTPQQARDELARLEPIRTALGTLQREVAEAPPGETANENLKKKVRRASLAIDAFALALGLLAKRKG